MPIGLLFVLVCLAAFRAVRLFTVDDFPPVVWARDRIESVVLARVGADWADGVSCPWCAGFWISEAVVALTWAITPLPMPALWFAAVPAVAGLISAYDGG